MSPRVRHPAAFTLIEMLVVISIITLLLSMSLPSLQHSRHNARVAQCASNQRQMTVAITTYADDSRFFPVGIDHHSNNSERVWLWPVLVRAYSSKEQGIFSCPHAPANTRWVKETAPGEPAYLGYEKDEKRIRGYTHKFSYGYNVWGAFMMQNPNTGLGVYRGHAFLDAAPQYAVKRPPDMIAFADSNPNDFWSGYIGPYRTGQWPSRIHFEKANVAFVDTHVTLVPRAELVDAVANAAVNKRWNNDHAYHPGSIQNDGVPDFP